MNRVERHVGAPTVYEELEHTPGCRLTLRAQGPRGSAIVKLYRSDRVASVAARIRALADGPLEPVVPAILEVDPDAGLLLLSDVPGTPLREAAIPADDGALRRAGSALGSWHAAWGERTPQALPALTMGDELASLAARADLAPRDIRLRVRETLRELDEEWSPVTVVHRNLCEQKLLIGERVGLIDLDDASAGPPELDVGNLLAHLELLGLRSGYDLTEIETALLDGYLVRGPLEMRLLDQCRRLGRMRLACIHLERRLLEPSQALAGRTW